MVPEHYIDLGDVMSNLDKSIDQGVAKQLKQGEYVAAYVAWNFCGYVWYGNGQYHCDIWVRNHLKETISKNSLEEIMEYCCSEYGEE